MSLNYSISYKDTLCPQIWDNPTNIEDGQLKKKVRDNAFLVAKNFYDELELDVDYSDITLTGSLANYNYTKYSDLDVHIIVDFSKVNQDEDLVQDAFDGKKFIWNSRHDIHFYNHELELYIQNENEEHFSTGVYSILDDVWLVEPEYSPPDIEYKSVEEKVNDITKRIDKLYQSVKESSTLKDNIKYFKLGKKLLKNLKNKRKESLEENGEFGIGNLTFKILRNTDNIEKLIKTTNKAYDKIYGIS